MKAPIKSSNINFDSIGNQFNFKDTRILQRNIKSNQSSVVNKIKLAKNYKIWLKELKKKKMIKKKKYLVCLEKQYFSALFRYFFVLNPKNFKILWLKKKKVLKYRVKHSFVYKHKSRIKFLIRDVIKRNFESLSVLLNNIQYAHLKNIQKNIRKFFRNQKSKKSQRFRVNPKVGFLYIHSKNNNIMCTFVDPKKKKVKTSCTLGVIKVEDAELKTDYERANDMGLFICQKIKDFKYTKISVIINGLSAGRKAVIKSLKHGKFRFAVNKIIDTTLPPHNGCRLAKVRRKKFRSKLSFKTANIISGI